MRGALEMCHNNRIQIYSFALNIGILIGFIMIVGLALYYSYKSQPTPYEKQQKMVRDQEYVLSKIRFYQSEQKSLTSTPIKSTNSVTFRDLVGKS